MLDKGNTKRQNTHTLPLRVKTPAAQYNPNFYNNFPFGPFEMIKVYLKVTKPYIKCMCE